MHVVPHSSNVPLNSMPGSFLEVILLKMFGFVIQVF